MGERQPRVWRGGIMYSEEPEVVNHGAILDIARHQGVVINKARYRVVPSDQEHAEEALKRLDAVEYLISTRYMRTAREELMTGVGDGLLEPIG